MMRRSGVRWAMLAGASALMLGAASAARADQLIDNVNGLTLDEQGQVRSFHALLIGADGRVKQLLDRKAKRPKKLTALYDGKGRTLLPAFAAPRCDLGALAAGALTLDLTGAASRAEVAAAVRRFADANPDRRWIIGHGWNSVLWDADAAALPEGLLTDRPVWLVDRSGAIGWANPAALAAAGINAATPAPRGGTIAIGATGPTGLLTGSALKLVEDKLPALRPAEADAAFARAQQALLSQGYAMVHDIDTDIRDWQIFRRAGDEGRLRLRIVGYAGNVADMALISGQRPTSGLYGDRLALAGLSLRLDGALAARRAWLKAPYADAPQEKGAPLLGEAELRNHMSRAAMDGFQLLLRAEGDAAVEEAALAVEELAGTYTGDRRWRIDGLALADAGERERMARLGMVVTADPLRGGMEPALIAGRLGAARAMHGWPLAELARGGASVALAGACGPALDSPLALFAAAIRTAAGEADAARAPMSRAQALAALTLEPARAARAEDRLGTLLPGRQADFLMLDIDPMAADAALLARGQVLESWVGGQRVYVLPPVPASTR